MWSVAEMGNGKECCFKWRLELRHGNTCVTCMKFYWHLNLGLKLQTGIDFPDVVCKRFNENETRYGGSGCQLIYSFI